MLLLWLPLPPASVPRLDGAGAAVTSPEATLKTVWRREWAPAPGATAEAVLPVEERVDEGATEKRARSWASVSRIREVMSRLARRAFAKIFGGGKLSWLSC